MNQTRDGAQTNAVEEQYNGWTNQETWALALHLGNDQSLDAEVRELVEGKGTFVAIDALKDWVETMVEEVLFPNDGDDRLSAQGAQLVRSLVCDVGSFWRVNWVEVVKSFQEETVSGTCRHCGRDIIHNDNDGWVDPAATGDDRVWRETCDAHDTFTAGHEPLEDTKAQH